MDKYLDYLGVLSSFLSVTLSNVKEVLGIISLILSILFTCFLIWKAIKNALSDGKITKEESKEILDLTQDLVEKGKQLEDKFDKGDKGKDV